MAKISAYSAITSISPSDLLVVVDVDDTTMAPTGTTKNMTLSQVGYFQPWQFLPETYGAVGNGKIISDVVLSSNTTLTSASAGFTSAVTGMTMMINGGAGNAGGPLVVTLTYVNATTVTLSSGASVSGSGFVAVYGTDDTAAINSTLSAGATYATTLSATTGSGNYFFEAIFGPKIYMLTSGPTQATSPQTNAQVVIPWPNVNGTTRKLVVALTGAGDNGYYQFWESLTPNAAGTTLMSTTTAPTSVSGTYGEQSVIGGPSAGGAFTGGYSNVKVVVRNMEVMCGAYTNQYAYDFGYVSDMRVQQSSAHIFAPTGVGGTPPGPLLMNLPGDPNFVGKIGTGLRSPVIGNNADITCDDFTVEGYSRGLYVFDHFTATRIGTIYNDVPLIIDTSQGASNVSHGVHIDLLSAEVFNGGILSTGNAPAYCPLYITLDAEVSGPNYDIHDAGNILYGVVHWTDPADVRAPVISGAANLKIINDKLGSGQWTGGMTPAVPSVPGSGTAATNLAYRDATVYLTSGGGAVTAVAVGTVSTGLTLGTSGAVTYRVPGGQATTLTYASSAPTWVWWLD